MHLLICSHHLICGTVKVLEKDRLFLSPPETLLVLIGKNKLKLNTTKKNYKYLLEVYIIDIR